MSVEMLVKGAIEVQMTDIADRVLADFKSVVGRYNKYSRTGEALGSLGILERTPDYVLIGGRNKHLFWLDEGNAQKGAIIYPKGKKPMYLNGIGIYRWSVRAHKPYRVAKEVADRHR